MEPHSPRRTFFTAVPRLLFDGWREDDYRTLFGSEDNIEDCKDIILRYVKVRMCARVED